MATYTNVDELVHSVTLFIPRPLFLHGYVLPFVILYASWIYGWIFVYGSTEYYEAGLVGISVIALCQLLCGLFCHWSVHVQCFFTCNQVKSPIDAKVVKVVPTPNNGRSELVHLHSSKLDDNTRHIWFIFQKTKYIWDEDKKTFKGIEFPVHYSFAKYMEWKGYQDENELQAAGMIYGKNRMDMVVPEFMELFKERATAPFFVFQIFCVALWCLEKFVYFSLLTLAVLVLFEWILVQQQLKNMAEIRNMGNKPYFIQVYRNRRWRPIQSDQLIAGDIVSIVRSQNENLVPCDVLLLRGSCIVDESMLTGESVPQMKEPIENADLRNVLNIESDGKLHVLFGGTKVVQHTPPSKVSGGLKAQDNGCVAYVLRTSFNTSQGKLLRTILFGVKRVTANNRETLAFILFLLVFAITAAAYVWIQGCEDPNRNRYKLFLECTLIVTSVVPPELPIELSLAVNVSLVSLSKLDVFCTEPFRIPFAGKIDICCFDKTGTLTSDNFLVEGVAGLPCTNNRVLPISEAPPDSIQVLATCHSLAQLDDGIVGDPLEKATLRAVDWMLTRADSVIPRKGKFPGMKIFQRYHFSSALKRMSVIAGYIHSGTSETNYLATVKGAPETLKSMFAEIPENYDQYHLEMTRRGARVLALGWKGLGRLTQQQIREMTRGDLECDLKFAGFVVMSCPLKYDSKMVVKEILNSSHSVVMITGDNPSTACHVAAELKITQKSVTLLLKDNGKGKWIWEDINETVELPFDVNAHKKITTNYDLCITGEGLTYLMKEEKEFFYKILPYIAVFARVAPKQKEQVILAFKSLGFRTVMCGDGTNDVGALKHADVGVAITSNAPEVRRERERVRPMLHNPTFRPHERNNQFRFIQNIMSELEDEGPRIPKLGDASIAAPFSSKLSSIQCICHIIKQGRCTLVTTLQMFKILALNALISAYSLSMLYLDGLKYSDFQMTFQGLLVSASFLFITWSKPLKTLSKQRPLPNIFNFYIVMTVLLQFLVHLFCLIFLVQEAMERTPSEDSVNYMGQNSNKTKTVKLSLEKDEDEDFVPNLLNSTVYILSLAFQVSTFAINYRGHPFMESLWENRLFLYSLLVTTGIVFLLALGISPEFSQLFEIVEFSPEFRLILVKIIVADFAFSYIFDRGCLWLLGEGKLKLQR